MPFVLLWGSLSDILGTKLVAVVAYCFVAAGFGGYVLAQHAWPDLLVARLVFAVGGSGVTAMLTGECLAFFPTFRGRHATHQYWLPN